MTVSVFHEFGFDSSLATDDMLYAALQRATEEGTCPPRQQVTFIGRPGPGVRHLSTRWHEFVIDKAALPLTVRSVLDEGAEDDAPYQCRRGLIASPSGSSTVYVCTAPKASRSWTALVKPIMQAADSDMFAPAPDPNFPISRATWSLRDELHAAIVAQSPDEDPPIPLAGVSWVDVVLGARSFRVSPTEGGGVHVESDTEVTLVAGDRTDREAEADARRALGVELAPAMEEAGMSLVRDDAPFDWEDDRLTFGASWERTVASASAAVALMAHLRGAPYRVEVD